MENGSLGFQRKKEEESQQEPEAAAAEDEDDEEESRDRELTLEVSSWCFLSRSWNCWCIDRGRKETLAPISTFADISALDDDVEDAIEDGAHFLMGMMMMMMMMMEKKPNDDYCTATIANDNDFLFGNLFEKEFRIFLKIE